MAARKTSLIYARLSYKPFAPINNLPSLRTGHEHSLRGRAGALGLWLKSFTRTSLAARSAEAECYIRIVACILGAISHQAFKRGQELLRQDDRLFRSLYTSRSG